jgi:lysophospholipase L1-like esterase
LVIIMRKQFNLSVLLIVAALLNFTACNRAIESGSNQTSVLSPEPSKAVVVTGTPRSESGTKDSTDLNSVEPTLVPEMEEWMGTIFKDRNEDYRKMIDASLITTGNNFRMKKVIEKAQDGKEVTIAYFGGSITEGAAATTKEKCYAYQSYLYFKETFGRDGGDNVRFVNAGMGGTPSALGVIRYDRDVTSFGQVQPDIVFIEFAVNDYQEPTKGAAFESMIRNVLKAPNQPAVVLLFSVFQTRWNMQDVYIPLGNYYKLPMISIKDAVVPELIGGKVTEEEFFADQYHPTDYGHGIMADCIKYYLNMANSEAAADTDIIIPEMAKVGKFFEGIKMFDSTAKDDNVTVNPGSFSGIDTQLVRFATGQLSFPNNWKHISAGGNDRFTMTLNCKNLLFVYKSCGNGSYGTADVYVDGTLATSLDSTQGGGWNNPMTVLLINEETASNHTIEIKMAEGNEEKEFTIMAFGYTK